MIEKFKFMCYYIYMEEIEFKKTIAENLIRFRRENNLTQLDLAKKLNYSDKAVSKWERGESIPDAYILDKIARIYNVSVDEILHKKENKKRIPFSLKRAFKNKHFLINCLSAGTVWLIACILFVVLCYTSAKQYAYLSFVFALPVSSLVNFILTTIWSWKWVSGIFATIFLWTGFLTAYLTVQLLSPIQNFWIIFIVAIPVQVLIILWYFLVKETKKIKRHMKQISPENHINEEQTTLNH